MMANFIEAKCIDGEVRLINTDNVAGVRLLVGGEVQVQWVGGGEESLKLSHAMARAAFSAITEGR